MSSPNVIYIQKYYNVDYENRSFYSSNQKDDYLGYISKGILDGRNYDYVDYMGNTLKSSGIFDAYGILSKSDIKTLREKLRNSSPVIWNGVISLEGEYGKEYLYDVNQAIELMKEVFPKYLKEAKYKLENIIWFAGLHENTDNRHIHICFFEKEPRYINPVTKEKKYRKGKVNDKAFNFFKYLVEEYFAIPNEELKQRRKELTEKLKIKFAETNDYTFFNLFHDYFRILYDEIPTSSKIGYNTANMLSLKETIDKATELILNNDDYRKYYIALKNQVVKKDDEIIRRCKKYNLELEEFLYSKKFDEDIKRRMGNILIKEIIKRRKKAYEEYKHIRDLNLLRKNELRINSTLVIHSIDLTDKAINGIDEAFDEFQRRLRKAEIDRLIEEGIIYISELEAEM